MTARPARHPIRDYWREGVAALVLLAVGAFFAWPSWEGLPRREGTQIVGTGTIRDLRQGVPSGGKYTLAHGPIAVIEVTMPGGGVQRFTGDPGLLDRCRRGDTVALTRYQNDRGKFAWALKADSCGGNPR
ncbi:MULTISPECIES: hypothetical protein [unclassified Sphingomonas]|uniref:hypothetical protein n=1 Tax=unclassified Sphingomonas TaxID=196159 RepID=UPI0022B53267|nr:hypothetical protein [Sphingomonas sp. NIBR02145]WHU01716.1 hypothetical protein O3305_16155 [Sphingomonas sp. NIBR02145]